MKIGIYISGLGQSVVNESVEKYAERLKNEMSYKSNGIDYEIKSEKVNYSRDRESTVVSICEVNNDSKVVYRLYDFNYHEILTEKFYKFSLIRKNLWLFFLVLRKFPLILQRLFVPSSHNRPLQTFYLFLIFIILASAILFMIPATITVVSGFLTGNDHLELINSFKNYVGINEIPFVSKDGLENLSKTIVSITAFLLLFMPNANSLITNLATEFVCANDYMEHGSQRQLIQGNLELLIDYITEHEADIKIHLHAYSFGAILAIDYIFPFGNKLSINAKNFCEALITIGSPFEFVKSYYPKYYDNRSKEIDKSIHWLNIYSIEDALATNFRNDTKIGEAKFGIDSNSKKPINLNYEVKPMKSFSLLNFVMLQSIRVHGSYWDKQVEGQSCLRLIHNEMINLNLL